VTDASSVLFGRASEEREIEARLSLAERGVGGLVVLVGEPGLGKTALAEHASVAARRRGFSVGWAACWQTAAVPPLQPWTELVGQLTRAGVASPDLAIPGGDRDSGRVEQASRVVEWLRELTDVPLLLVVDDLHWADAATLWVLTRVASVLASMPVVVVVAHRPIEAAAALSRSESIAVLQHHGLVLELRGLDIDGTTALVAAVRGQPVPDAAARSVWEITGGNPLFTRELARALPASVWDRAIDVRELAIPATLRALVADRRSSLSEECQAVLDALSVVGDQAELGFLAAVCDRPTEEVLDLLDEAGMAGLAELHANTASYRHALFRAAVYESLSSATRARLHDRLGHELEARRRRGIPVDAAALAHHFGRAAPLGNAAPAFSYALEAAADAESLLSFDVAARRFEQALAMLAIDPGLGDRLAVKLALGDALVAAGDITRARKTFREVAGEASRVGDRPALGRAALGFSGGMTAMEVVISDAEVCELLDRAVEVLQDDNALGARLAARLSVALSHRAPLAQRTELASGARARAVACGDPAVIAETLAAWCDVVAGPDHLEERREAASEIIDRAVGVGDVGVEALGRRLLVQALFEAGDLRDAEVEVSRFERASARLGRSEYLWYPPLWRASLALARGQMQAQARARAQLEAMVGEVRGTNAVLLAGLQQGMMALDLADPNLAGESLGKVRVMEVVDDTRVQVIAALVRAFSGDYDEARGSLDRCADAALAAERDSAWPALMMNLAELIVAVGGHAAAEAVRHAIEPYATVWVVSGIGAAIRGPLDRVLGSLAALDGDLDAADSHFAAAHDAALRAGAVLVAAVVDHQAGRTLGDRARLDRAAEVWRRVGANGRLAQIEALTESPAPRRAAPAEPGNRFVRDGDAWSITFNEETCVLTDRKGLRDLARLLAEPGREIAAQDLMASGGTVIDAGGGPVIDDQARATYRARLLDIAAELDKADAAGDRDRSSGLAAEQEALIAELRGAYGLGGRPRRGGVSAERARTAVRSRIHDAVQRIEVAHPVLGRHLARSVRTGSYCVYQPDPPVDWTAGEAPHTV
jgi:tetratricopeptide (TPR) repeat protein